MAITVTPIDLGTVVLPEWHPRVADQTCLIQGSGSPVVEDVHDASWLERGRPSIERLKSFEPHVVHLSQDRQTVRRTA